uniref:MH2 domain-containing protein n=1 Tax=Ascaris lumbricoides TaxID=6252 RepID=A0A0M3I1Z5_ASCLU
MEVGRTLAGHRGSSIPGEPIVVNVDANHTHWFYDTLCSRAERVITTGPAEALLVNNNFWADIIILGIVHLLGQRTPVRRSLEGSVLGARNYAYCCKEVRSGCSSAAKSLASKIGNLSCITKHPSFASVCLDVEVLNMLATHEGVCTEWLGPEEKFMNRDYRYVAFRAFSYWTHGDDSRGNKLEPPLCVLARIVQVL